MAFDDASPPPAAGAEFGAKLVNEPRAELATADCHMARDYLAFLAGGQSRRDKQ